MIFSTIAKKKYNLERSVDDLSGFLGIESEYD